MNAFNSTKQLFLSLVFTLLSISIFAQKDAPSPSYQFEIFEMPGGALGNHCQTIVQDPLGYMWFGTQYGLHRWDGYNFKTFQNNPIDSSSISMSYVEYIHVAKDSTLWLGTWGGGMNHYDPETERFTRYVNDPNDQNSLNNNFISDIQEDDDGDIWIATLDGVSRFNPKTGIFKTYKHDPDDANSLSYDIVRVIYKDSKGELWFGTGWFFDPIPGEGGLNKYNPETDDFTVYQNIKDKNNTLINNKISEIFEDSKGNFWVGTVGEHLHLMDRAKGEFRLINTNQNTIDLYENSDENIELDFVKHSKFVFEDKDDKLWFGFWNGGIKYYDPETGLVQHYIAEDKSKSSIPDNFVWTMMQSKDGTLWACTANRNAKVFKIIPKSDLFNIQTTNFADAVLGYYESASGIQWFSEDVKGLIRVDPKRRDTVHYLDDPLQPHPYSFLNNPINPIASNQKRLFQNIDIIKEDREGNLWLGKGNESGLVKFNPNTGKYTEYLYDENDDKSLSANEIKDVLVDSKGKVWVTTISGDLNKYNPKEDNFTRFSFVNISDYTTQNSFESYYMTSSIIEGEDNSLWIAFSATFYTEIKNFYFSEEAGFVYNDNKDIKGVTFLKQFDLQTESFQTKTFSLPTHFGDLSEKICGIEMDASGNIWVATLYSLHKYNPKNGLTESKNVQEFNTPYFVGMTMDNDEKIWLAGNGLIVYDPVNETSFTYASSSGVTNLPFQRNSMFKNADGKIIVGGKSGLLSFYPKEIGIENPSSKPDLLITNFELFEVQENQPNRRQSIKNIWEQKEIRLSHNQNVFTFEFATLDFFSPTNNLHTFKLENYDQNWRSAGLEPKITYVKVPPGEYTFRVRGANHQGVWSDEKSIRIIIEPPWWNTLWAKIAFYASLVFLIFGFYRFQLNRRLQYAEANRLRELDAVKSQLYTNITHEFRTPLTVISGMITQIRENPKEWFNEGLNMISRNNERLLNLVNQMLDLSKLESGKMTVNLVQSDVVGYVKYLVEAFDSYAESERIQLHFYSEVEELLMDYDAEKLQQVITNLLSNGVKFTPEGGNVYISVREEKGDENGSPKVLIKIRDTGIGISDEQIEHIFDRFYQVDDSNTRQKDGSGIGLALTYELVKLMGGEIKVKSKKGSGTEFIVEFPVRNEAIQTDPLNIEKNPLIENIISKASPVYKKYESVKSEPDTSVLRTTKPQILLIEDNPDVVAYVASFLDKDYQIKVGKDGQEGIELALKNVPDLIISDVMMPYKDGFEVCENFKK